MTNIFCAQFFMTSQKKIKTESNNSDDLLRIQNMYQPLNNHSDLKYNHIDYYLFMFLVFF